MYATPKNIVRVRFLLRLNRNKAIHRYELQELITRLIIARSQCHPVLVNTAQRIIDKATDKLRRLVASES